MFCRAGSEFPNSRAARCAGVSVKAGLSTTSTRPSARCVALLPRSACAPLPSATPPTKPQLGGPSQLAVFVRNVG
jgi:hypothetical protein